jgi:diacylglycerol kinase family enzyme
MKGEAVPIDVGKANDHWFINAASSGFGAEITATTSPELKRLFGPAAYTVMGAILAINLHHYQGKLILPGREITGSGPVAIVGNGRQTGAVSRSLLAHASMTVYSMCLSFVRSRQQRCSPRRENCNSFRPTASTSPIGKRPGWRCILKKQFQSTSMVNP